MDYYNLARLIKNVVYNFMRMFKYMSYCLIAICFIAVCLLLMSSHSKAQTFTENSVNFYVPDNIYNKFVTSEYYNDDYYCLLMYNRSNNSAPFYWKSYFVPKNGNSSFTWFFRTTDKMISSNTTPTGMIACLNMELDTLSYTFNATWKNTFVYNTNQQNYMWGRGGILNRDTNVAINFPIYQPFIAPEISFPHDNGTTDYISGEFAHFFIVGNSAETVYFHLNDGSVDDFSSNKSISLMLNHDSPYYINNYLQNDIYLVPKNILGGYYDGHIYNMWLSWQENNVWEETEVYSWTTSFSEQAILNDEERYRQELNNSINELNNSQQETNDFLMDDSVDNNEIINNMPDFRRLF